MNAHDFRTHTNRLVQQQGPILERRETSLATMALGLAGEAGEVCDEIKKILAHGKPLDVNKIINEIGDVLFYADRVLAYVNSDLSEAMLYNYNKLMTRYPEGFDSADRKFGFTKEEGA